jgi:two-component system response regulator
VRAEENDILLVEGSSYDLGVNSYIQKPVDFDQFRETVHALALYWLLLNQPPPRIPNPHRTEKAS